MASPIHDTSPILRHSLQQSHNKGLCYGFRDAILSRLVTIIYAIPISPFYFMKFFIYMSPFIFFTAFSSDSYRMK